MKETHTCEYCQTPGKYIAVESFGDTRLFLGVSGEYIQIFDEEYPGRITNIKINNCPMCGRPLRAEEIIIKTNRVLRGLRRIWLESLKKSSAPAMFSLG